MDMQRKETIVEDPLSGVTEVRQETQEVATPAEVEDAHIEKKNQVLWYVIGVINALLALRIIFLLFDARDVGFASIIYALSDPFVVLFRGIFPAPSVEGAYFDTAAILAIIVISLLGWGLSALLDVLRHPTPVPR